MMPPRLLLVLPLLLLNARGLPSASAQEQSKFPAAEVAFYEKEVLPLLKTHCLKCHGGEGKKRGNLDLTHREGILKGGDLGPAVSLDQPQTSLLLKAIRYQDGLEMPPTGRLKPAEVEVLTQWVMRKIPHPADRLRLQPKEPAKVEHQGGVVTAQAKNYWAFQPIRKPTPPKVQNAAWVRNPIDAFLLAKLEAKGLTPNGPADKVALIRRATYDLIGLPPTPEEVDAFVHDTSPNAYPALIERLLQSPHYGEKWGRHWLDLVRYAETNGYERDGPKPYAWRYRDYVIRSFNADKPYDQFIREQLAGDELPGWNPDAIIATGYYRLGLWDDEAADPLLARYDELDDFVTTTSQVFLGLTLNCVRCHEHKIDPIPHADYYRFLAFFTDINRYSNDRNTRSMSNLTDITPPEQRKRYEAELVQREAQMQQLRQKMTQIENDAIRKMPAEDQRASEGPEREAVLKRQLKKFLSPPQDQEYFALKRELEQLQRQPQPERELALSVNNCNPRPPATTVLLRGNPRAPGAKVEPGFPSVLGVPDPELPEVGPNARTSGRRTILANWIASPNNPLTARVLVNRLWQYHFGRGIVASSNDFGKFGTGPTHPELLDWLASTFIEGGWKLKSMHRLIMLSNAYQMASTANPQGLKVDPANHLLWRFSMRRLTAEEVRDSILAVSGRLYRKAGGPSVYPVIPREVLAGQSIPGSGWGQSPPHEANRRSVYVHVKRSLQVPILATHDQADTDASCPVRYTTTVATQALGMLNGQFTNDQAAAFAQRLTQEAPNDLPAQVRRAIRLTTGRVPTAEEVQKDVAFAQQMQTRLGDQEGLRVYCLMILNTNEFVYLD